MAVVVTPSYSGRSRSFNLLGGYASEAHLLHVVLARGTHPKYVQHLAKHASIHLTLDRYSHWILSMGRATAEGMNEALG
jgi:hypothetical protein